MICRNCSRRITWAPDLGAGIARHASTGRVTCGPEAPGHRAEPDPEFHVDPEPDDDLGRALAGYSGPAEPLPVNAGDDGRWGGSTPSAMILDEVAQVPDEVWDAAAKIQPQLPGGIAT